jgi:NAD(P)-dependent dehydrogenase (short-subunit alcohol dehydrogenase family)
MADKTVMIVGAGAGFGAALGRRFADAGYDIEMTARNPDRLRELVAESTAKGVRAEALGVDATDEAGMVSAFDTVEANLGPIDLAVYNVNGRKVEDLTELSANDFEESWSGLCLGEFIMGREAARRMLPRERGSIFFTGGRAGRHGLARFTAFASAKAGLRSLAECIARELGPHGIHVAHFAVEASLGNEQTRASRTEMAAKDAIVHTDNLAEVYFNTHQQPRNCWAFEIDLRPWCVEFI